MALFDRLRQLAPGLTASDPAQAVANWQATESHGKRRGPVPTSGDLDRVLALPRRQPLDVPMRGEPLSTTVAALVGLMGERLRRTRSTPCSCKAGECITELLPAQAWALYEAQILHGLIAPIGVGHGKTGLNFLLSMVLPNVKLAVLLIKPDERHKTRVHYERWAQHWRLPSIRMGEWGHIIPNRPILHVIAYSMFSRPESTKMLESLSPDLIIGDEAHLLSNIDAARTKRLFRFGASHPQTMFCFYSGTLLNRSVKPLAALCALGLKGGSPLPLDPDEADKWASAVDPAQGGGMLAPGALAAFVAPEDKHGELTQNAVRRGLHRRIVDTVGVCATREGAIDASINLRGRGVGLAIPREISRMLQDVRETWCRPDGEELIEALDVHRCLRELACGFYYRWKFPRGESIELIKRWLAVRKEWHRELRDKVKAGRQHLDSPHLCEQAAVRFYRDQEGASRKDEDLPRWSALVWPEWRDIRSQVQPVTEAVWVDDFLALDAVEWARDHRGVVWYEQRAFGERVARLGGLPLHCGGQNAERDILAEKGDRSIVASIKSHGTGRDGLQLVFATQLVANPPTGAMAWEQLLGRLHRIGQDADAVDCHVYRHTPEMSEAIDKAVKGARFVRDVMGTCQKLLAASADFEIDNA